MKISFTVAVLLGYAKAGGHHPDAADGHHWDATTAATTAATTSTITTIETVVTTIESTTGSIITHTTTTNTAPTTNRVELYYYCLLYTSPSPRDRSVSRMPSSA